MEYLRCCVENPLTRSDVNADGLAHGPERISNLSEPLRSAVRGGLADSLASIYLVAAVFAVVGLLAAIVLRELPLRETAAIVDADPRQTPSPTIAAVQSAPQHKS